MRSDPGTNFGKASSIAEGTYVTILFNTGLNFDGYNWFEIVLDNGRRGFIWGGILCSNGPQLPGIYSSCTNYQQQSNQQQTQSQNNRGWMAFAVGNNGRWGHGAGQTLSDARNYAMNNCGASGCQLVDETQAQCHAMATVPRGVIGSAHQMPKTKLSFSQLSSAQIAVRMIAELNIVIVSKTE